MLMKVYTPESGQCYFYGQPVCKNEYTVVSNKV